MTTVDKTIIRRNYLTEIMLIIIVIVAINLFSSAAYLRFDFTQNKRFTLAPISKKVVQSLKDPLNIYVFLSRKLPPEFLPTEQGLRDQLAEYAARANNNLRIQFIDPGEDEKKIEMATNMKVQAFQIQVYKKGESATQNVYCGLAIKYRDKEVKSIPMITANELQTLEYAITSTIMKLTNDQPKKIAVRDTSDSRNNGPQNPMQPQQPGYASIVKILQREFEVVELPKGFTSIPSDVKAVFIFGSSGITEAQTYVLDQFMVHGGKVVVSHESFTTIPQYQQFAIPQGPGDLNKWLQKVGVSYGEGIVCESLENAAMVGVQAGPFQLQLPYPLWVRIPKKRLSEHSTIQQLNGFLFPYCAPLKIELPTDSKLKADPLAWTSPESYVVTGPLNLTPDQDWKAAAEKNKSSMRSYPVAVDVEGKYQSVFTSKPSLKGNEAILDSAKVESELPEWRKGGDKDSSLIILGSSKYLEDGTIDSFMDGAIFTINLADYFTLGEGLIKIRSRNSTDRPLDRIPDNNTALVIRLLNVIGLPVVIVGFGLWRLASRNNRRKLIQERYAHLHNTKVSREEIVISESSEDGGDK